MATQAHHTQASSSVRPPLPGPQDVELRARWHRQDAGGGTLLSQTLEALRSPEQRGTGAVQDLRGIGLVGADLSGLDFSGCDLSGADLSEANLRDARLCRANLHGAILHGADLRGADLLACDLREAVLSECKAAEASFGNARLSGAQLTCAQLERATLSGACLARADLKACVLSGARLRDADLAGADFCRARLDAADLEGATVTHAAFRDADLRGATLRGVRDFATATFLRCDIRDVNFSGAYLVRRHIMDENYLDEFRRQSRLTRVVYQLWWVTSDCGRSISRFGLWMLLFMLGFGFAYQYCAIDYGDHPTALSPYYFSLVTLTTLGYGDVLPKSGWAQALVMVQVSAGYMMLAGLASIFANKMARRAE